MRYRASEPLKWDLKNSLGIETQLAGSGGSILNSFLIEQIVNQRDAAFDRLASFVDGRH